MKIINKYLFIQTLQIILPFYIICFILYVRKLLVQIYIKNTNIQIKQLTNKIIIYNYNKNNKTIVVINGGGLFFDDMTDIVIVNNILQQLNNYNVVVIKYTLFNKISDTLQEVNNTFNLLLTYNLDIKVFIGNSIGCTLLLNLFNIHTQFTKEKLILISPIVNYNVKCNKNCKTDFINFIFYNYIKNKYYDKNVIINYNVLPNTFIICGSNEIFYDDIINFHNKCKNSNLYCIQNGIHSEYILYGIISFPFLFSSNKIKKITNKIINFIKN